MMWGLCVVHNVLEYDYSKDHTQSVCHFSAVCMKRKIIIIIILLSVLAGAGWYIWNQQVKSIAAKDLPEGSTYTVKQTKLTETLTISGDIDAEDRVSLFFPTGGRLAWVGVKEGDYVKQYQGIASLDQRDVQKRLEQTLNTYMTTRWDFEQTKQDNKEAQYKDGDLGDRMKRLIDKAQFGLNNSVLTVELQAIAKELAYLYTPIDGIVTKVGGAHAGMSVLATATYEIVNPETVYFSATADQTDIPQLSVGQTATLILDAYEDEKLTGVVQSIGFTPKVGDTGTTYEVKIAFASSNDLLKYRLGMTGDAEFITKEKVGIFAVPLNFVKTEAKEKVVYILKDGKEQRTVVTLGEEGDDSVEIKRGVKEGDVLIIKK